MVPWVVVSMNGFFGKKGGREGVKLEDESLIPETSTELLSRLPYEDEFLNGRFE